MATAAHPFHPHVRTAEAVLDARRLAALEALELLDTPAEPTFDRLTELVAEALDAPVACVSLVHTDRQFFKSAHGLGDLRETPLSHSVCQFVVAAREPLVFEDLTADDELRQSPAVTDLGIAAYAGVPLITPEGHAVGALCALDRRRRSWRPSDVKLLEAFAAAAMAEADRRIARWSADASALLFAAQKQALALLATGAGLEDVLDALVLAVEAARPGLAGAVLLHEADLLGPRCASAPSLSPRVAAALECEAGRQDAGDGDVVLEDLARHPGAGWARAAVEHGHAACWSSPVTDGAGTVLGTFWAFLPEPRAPLPAEQALVRDTTHLAGLAIARRRADQELERAARHDELTGLPNRRLLLERLERSLRGCRVGRRVGLLLVDLDRFKLVNDSLGHDVGDHLVRSVAQRLREAMRAEDLVARLGGDELVVVCEGLAGPTGAEAVAARIRAVLEAPFDLGGELHFATASVGIALGTRGDRPEVLLRNADAAMYAVKAAGGAGHELFDERLLRAVERERTLDSRLRDALDRGHLAVVYQPIVGLDDGVVRGVEALLRWQDPELGAVSPAEFVPLAEKSGAIVEIGAWVLERALTDLAVWRRTARDLGVSVNVSGRQLADPGFGPRVAALLEVTGVPGAALTLELTETGLIEASAVDALHELADLGVHLSIDDFGTGYSSLSRLQSLPFSEMKIDRSFISGAASGCLPFVRALMGVGEALGLQIVAEGIETDEQRTALEAVGCGHGQGYLFARPMPAEEVPAILGRPALALAA